MLLLLYIYKLTVIFKKTQIYKWFLFYEKSRSLMTGYISDNLI